MKNKIEINKYAVGLVQQEFVRLGFKIETSTEKSSLVNFNIILKNGRTIKMKTRVITQMRSYVFNEKSKFDVEDPDLFMTVVYMPDLSSEKIMYLIPAKVWSENIYPFKGKDYDKPGQVSKPEWGISFSQKAKDAMEPYRFSNMIRKLV